MRDDVFVEVWQLLDNQAESKRNQKYIDTVASTTGGQFRANNMEIDNG